MGRINFWVWVLLALLAAPATAQAAWTPVGTLSDPGNALDLRVAMGTGGDAAFAWAHRDATSDCSGFACLRIQARARSADGTLSATQILSLPGENVGSPDVAVDADGNAVFVWDRPEPTTDCGGAYCFRIQSRTRAADGTLSPIQTLSPPGRHAQFPQVALDGSGNAVFVWQLTDVTTDCGGSGCDRIQTRVRSADGTLSAPQTLSPPGKHAFFFQMAVNVAGRAVFAWERNDGTTGCAGSGCYRVQGRVRSADGALSATQTLSAAGQHAGSADVAVDAAGDAVFAWHRLDGSSGCGGFSGCSRSEVRARSADGTLSATQILSAAGQHAEFPKVTVDASGNAIVAWYRPDGTTDCAGSGCNRVQARARSAAGALGATETLSAAGQSSSSPLVAGDAGGNALFVWLRYDGTTDCGGFPGCVRVQARARSAAGALGATQTLSDPARDASQPGLAVDPDGGLDPNRSGGVAVWALRHGTGNYCCDRVQAAVQIAPPPF